MAGSLLADANTADDVVQDACLAALERPPRKGPLERAWFVGVVRNLAHRTYRDTARRERRERAASRSDVVLPAAQAAEQIEAHRRLVDAVHGLADPYRTAIVLRYFDGLSPREIAARHGVPRETASTWIHRGLAMLRSRLEKDRDDWRAALLPLSSIRRPAPIPQLVPVAGAIAMSAKKVLVVVAAVLLLVGGGIGVRAMMSGSANSKTVSIPTSAGQSRPPRAKAAPALAPGAPLPAPVDLDQCDRDLDLFGRVIDEAGTPVADADVATLHYPWRGLTMWSAQYAETESGPATRTAKDGTFAVRLERGDRFDLRVTAPGFGELVRTDCQAGERVEIVLRRGATLDVTTVDESGAAVPGVRVELRRDQRRFAPLREERKTVTDAAGHAAISGLLPGPFSVSYLHPTLGEPKWEPRVLPIAGTLTIRVTMRGGRTLTGRVTDAETGKPIVGARIDNWNFQREVATGADGRYTLHGWTSHESMPVEAKAHGYCSAFRDSASGDVVDFALQPGDRVTGRLVDEHGAPVADALVGAYGSAPQPSGRNPQRPSDSDAMRTAADGRFDLGGLSRDIPHTLVAVARGRARTLVAFDHHIWTGATIDLGDVVMKSPRSIDGVVVDLAGKPLADATVRLLADGADRGQPGGFLFEQQRRTDDLGRYRFTDLAAGTYGATVSALNAPGGSPTRIDLPEDEDVRGVRLTLAGGGSITLLVVDETGAPAEGVTVFADVNENSKVDGLLAVPAGTDGRVTFRGLRAVATRFNVGRDDGRHVMWIGPVVPEGQEIRVVVPREAEIRGVVRGEDGKPLASYVRATLRRDGSDAGSGSSDETGAFTLKVPIGAIVDLWARGTIPDAHGSTFTGFEGRADGVTGPKDDLVITLRAMNVTYDRSLTVVVQDSTGVPFPGIELGIYEPPKAWKVKTDADGRARFDGLPSHLVVVNFAEMQDLTPQHPLDIAPHMASVTPTGQELVVKYRAGAAIRGRVVDEQGRGVGGASVQVTTSDGTYITARCDTDGRFSTCGLPGLRHSLAAQGLVDGTPCGGDAKDIVPSDAEVTITLVPAKK